uniref:Sec-independent protein translocase n=1 Tax=Toxarium undulatum TaxID=210620 RepID=A0A2U9GI93_9STRA|nr:Sec-independent protein translocase [Toxarium undulatum]AWQ64144.1 Sec-independent protein translocase [Toxarium undulatum]
MFKKYMIELKNRGILILFSWICVFLSCYNYKNVLFFLMFIDNPSFNTLHTPNFIFTNLTDVLNNYLYLSAFISNQIVLVMLFYHFLIFLKSGLYNKEYALLKSWYFLYVINTCLSILILHFYILPFSWQFFLSFQNETFFISFEGKVNEHLVFYKNLYYLLVFYTQGIFTIFYSLFWGIINFKYIILIRKTMYLLFFLTATILTPPEVCLQLLVGSLQICLYEFLVFVQICKACVCRW